MNAMGADTQCTQALSTTVASFKQALPDVPDEFWVEFESKSSADEILEMSTAVYKKYLSTEDAHGLTTFFSTPLGKKYVAMLPAIQAELQKVGVEWGRSLGERVERDLQGSGIPLNADDGSGDDSEN